jgi:Uma2 family endonuclease
MTTTAQLVEPHKRLWTKEEYYRLGEFRFFDGQKVKLICGDIITQYPDPERSGLPYRGVGPQSRLWTKAEYYRLGELGFFQGQKAELIEGKIMVLSPQKWPHASTTDRVGKVLEAALGTNVWVRTQLPLNLGLVSDPEPDVSVVPGKREDYTDHPTTALLIAEVSDTTLAYDRGEKASLYASAGIADYWVVNVRDGESEVRRSPIPDPSEVHGYRYADVATLSRGDQVTPLAAPSISIAVADLLP